MRVARGDVVLVLYPQAPGRVPKRRRAVVVQSDHNNGRMANSIFAMITSNTSLATTEPAQVFVDTSTPEGQQSGLDHASAIKCENLHTIPTTFVYRKLGSLPPSLMQQVDDALKASLSLT